MTKRIASLLIVFSFSSWAAPQAKIDETNHVGRIYVSGEPSEQALAAFKKDKGAVILDLREFNELGTCSQPVTATKLGLVYNRVVFEKKAEINHEVISSIDKVVSDAGSKPVLLFCKTGNRAASYLAIHLVRDQKVPLEDAIRTARSMGLQENMEQAVRSYLAKKPQ